MGEIKSTLELALERTKGLVLSDEEKEGIRQKEIAKRATSLFHRYLENHLSLNDLLKEIERMETRTARVVKETLLAQWIDALSLSGDNEKCLKGILSLKGDRAGEMAQTLQTLFSRFREECEKAKEVLRIELTEGLKRLKIHGSAVDPNVEGNLLWEKRLAELEAPCRVQLEEMKTRLKAS
jgi:hypothetical protein